MPLNDDPTKARIYISDREHPHFGESGTFTGKVIMVLKTMMAEVTLDDCKHGTGGCFVQKGQFRLEKRS